MIYYDGAVMQQYAEKLLAEANRTILTWGVRGFLGAVLCTVGGALNKNTMAGAIVGAVLFAAAIFHGKSLTLELRGRAHTILCTLWIAAKLA